MWTVEHQGFKSGHPWRVEQDGICHARMATHAEGEAFALGYIAGERNERNRQEAAAKVREYDRSINHA